MYLMTILHICTMITIGMILVLLWFLLISKILNSFIEEWIAVIGSLFSIIFMLMSIFCLEYYLYYIWFEV